jgi:O-antigen/teichoic acid export membrane protein
MGVIQRQGIKNVLSSYSGILIGFVSLLIIQPHFLKPEEIGLARVLFAFSTLMSTIIPFGITNVTIKYFPAFKNPKNGHNGFLGFILLALCIGFILSAIGLFVFREFIIAQYRRESPLVIYYYNYIFPFSFFLALISVLTNYLIALFKSTVPSYLNDVGTRLAYITLILLYFFHYLTLPQFIGGYVGIYAVQSMVLVFYLVKVDRPSLIIDWNFVKKQDYPEMLRFGLLLSTATLAALGLKSLDVIFLGKFKPLNFAGIYTIAAFIPTIIEAPLNALDRIVTGAVAHSHAGGKNEELKSVFYKSVKYLSLIGGLLFVGVNTNIIYLLNLVGQSYTQGVEVVYIISLGSLITMFGGSSNALLIYTSKPWQGAVMLLGLVVVTIICNMLLIPLLGMNGAALSTAISALLFTAGKSYLNYRRLGFWPYDSLTIKVLGIILLCFAINYFLPVLHSDVLNIALRSALLGGVYLALVYGLRLVPEFHKYLPWERKK